MTRPLAQIACVFLMSFYLARQAQAQDPNFHIYLCFGQSNMEGQGKIESQDSSVDARFKVLQSLDCANLDRTKNQWYPVVPPLCQCYSGLSPADYFGRTMIANLPDSITIGVINVAVGGCDIRLFDKDIYTAYLKTYNESWFTSKIAAYGNNPYQHLINLAKLAQKDGVIKGILLHQGETNTGQVQWPAYVKKIYKDMLKDLSLSAGDVPLLAGEVLSASGSCCASMNAIINRLPDTLSTAYVISSSGCTGQDNAHFDSKGYRELGKRYAKQMLEHVGIESVAVEPECISPDEDWLVVGDKSASNLACVEAAKGKGHTTVPADEDGVLKVDFSVNDDTTYVFYGRFNMAVANSLWIKVDDGDYELYDSLTTDGWQWLEITSASLLKGEHTLRLCFGEGGGRLDKLAIQNSRFTPSGLGAEAASLCEADIDVITGGGFGSLAGRYVLRQNYPNPSLDRNTHITFEIPERCDVSLKIYDATGVEMDELAGREYGEGEHILTLDTGRLQPGVYFYTIRTAKFSSTKKMVVPVR